MANHVKTLNRDCDSQHECSHLDEATHWGIDVAKQLENASEAMERELNAEMGTRKARPSRLKWTRSLESARICRALALIWCGVVEG